MQRTLKSEDISDLNELFGWAMCSKEALTLDQLEAATVR